MISPPSSASSLTALSAIAVRSGSRASDLSTAAEPVTIADQSYRFGQVDLRSHFSAVGVATRNENLSLTVNGKKEARPLNMRNFAGAAKGDWEKGWTYTFSIVRLNKGTNTITVSCEDGNRCDVNLDQMWLKKG